MRRSAIRDAEAGATSIPRVGRTDSSLSAAMLEADRLHAGEDVDTLPEPQPAKRARIDGSQSPALDEKAELEVSRMVRSVADGRSYASKSSPSFLEGGPALVDWDGPNDARAPRNWAKHSKIAAVVTVSMFTFLSPTASSMMAPAAPLIARDLGVTSSTEEIALVSIFLLAYAVRPLRCTKR